MATIVGEEFVCYGESSTSGHYTPLIGILKYDGSVSFRDIVKEDFARIADDTVFPGSWLFRQTVISTGSWVKRFCILRGDFIFLFHSPTNAKPISLIPLLGAKIVMPENGEKTFDEQRHFKANEGYEFDVRHTNRPTVRLYCLSNEEREDWVKQCKKRVYANTNTLFDSNEKFNNALPAHSNIRVTSTRLSGLLLSGQHGDDTPSAEVGVELLPTSPAPPQTPYVEYSMKPISMPSPFSPSSPPPPPPPPYSYAPSVEAAASVSTTAGAAFFSPPPLPAALAPNPLAALPQPQTPLPAAADPLMQPRYPRIDLSNYAGLEQEISRILAAQREARERQAKMMHQLRDKAYLAAAKEREEKQPVTLAEMFRQMLYFYDAELAEDPNPNSAQQFPHVKGAASEHMLLTVYRRYCSDGGFMTLEQLVEFIEDSGILQTHVPHDDNDEPLEEFRYALDPVRLLFSVPKLDSLEAQTYTYYGENGEGPGGNKDKFTIGFGQFYQLLLHITQVIYPQLYCADETVAFNKLLVEVLLPLFVWCNRCKRGSSDVCVLEERILLCMCVYSPNLWKVFLTYAADAVGKIPEITLPFPESAQHNERFMYKAPLLCADHLQADGKNLADSLVVSEAGALRFARDYGLTPYLLTTAMLRAHYTEVCRPKVIVSSRLPTREQVAVKSAIVIDRTKKKEPVSTFMFGRHRDSRFGTPQSPDKTAKRGAQEKKATKDEVTVPHVTLPPAAPVSGLSFSEFVELIARIAVTEMQQPSYHSVFPTPFAKTLAMLTVWGVADLAKLEEVRTIRTDEAY